jgi:VWFA-related protein
MIGRVLLPALWCGALLAQLPPPQAAPPKADLETHKSKTASPDRYVLQVDARVTDRQGQAVTGLTAADFTIETDGKPQKVEQVRFVEPEPARVALVIDDLSLSLAHLNEVRAAVRKAVDEIPPGHEFAIVRTSGGEGTLEQFTSDRAILAAALDQIVYNPLQLAANVYPVGTLGTLQAVLDGARMVAGRKAVLLFSERLRDAERTRGAPREIWLKPAANRGSVVVYGFDAAASGAQSVMLDEGIAALTEDTGGRMFESGVDPAQAISQILRDQAAYYAISFEAEGLTYDYLARMPKIGRLVLRTSGDRVTHWRKNAMGGTSDAGAPFLAPGDEPSFALTSAFAGTGIHTRLTPLAGIETPSRLDVVFHIDPRDVVLTRETDGLYRGQLQIAAEIFGNTSMGVQNASNGVRIQLGEATLQEVLDHGFDSKLTLKVPIPGTYLLRVAVADAHSSHTGSASQVIQIPDWNGGKLTISSILLTGALPKDSPKARAGQYLDASAPARVFPPGSRIPYAYYLYNLHRNQDKHGQFEVRSQLFREGEPIYTSAPQLVEIDLPAGDRPAAAGGFIGLTQQTLPGRYTMLLTVTDKLAPESAARSATQTIDFQVRP